MKFILSLLILTIGAFAIGQTTNMPQNGSNSITSCAGNVRDPGGNQNYQNSQNGTLTICSGNANYISLNFTLFNLQQNFDFLRIYSGVGIGGPLIATLTGNGLPPGPILISNTCVTLVFTSDQTGVAAGFQLTYSCYTPISCTDGIQNGLESGIDCGGCSTCPPCSLAPNAATISATASVYNLPCGGGSVNLNALGVSTTPVLSSNFNLGSPGPGWTFTGSGMFTNPCGPSPSNTTHIWFGNASQHPRILTTNGMDLSCGGTICFDLKFAIQGASGSCEGPDLPNEGVTLSYSTNCGSTFQNIAYFHPNGTIIGANPNTTTPGISGATPFTTWGNHCFPIPPAAMSPNTIIRWSQLATSGAIYDHWGLDEVVINANNCNPYYYDWAHLPGSPNSPATTVNVTSTSTYNVIYTNGIDDTASTSITIVVDGPTASTISTTPVNYCVGPNSGTATFTGNGATPPNYTFQVSGPGGFTTTFTGSPSATITSLPVGNYTLTTIETSSGCSTIAPFVITGGPFCCDVTVVPTNLTCNVSNAPCNGVINSIPSNGQGPYLYQWYTGVGTASPIIGQTAQSINSRCAGTYTVRITDQTGCTDIATTTLTQPTPLVVSNTSINVNCNGANNGSITATASGGTPGYTYTSGTTSNGTGVFSPLSPGNYTITATNLAGCTANTTATIAQPLVLNYTITSTVNPTCNLNNGQIIVSASGGIGPYNFSTGGITNTSGSFTGLAAGTYTISISDANGCAISTYPITLVNQSSPILVLDSVSNVTCFGFNTGYILVSATGNPAISGFTYSINAGPFTTNNSFSNLAAGTYPIIVRDINLCTASISVTITAPALLSLASSVTNATCYGICNGTITNIVSGGTAPFNYSLDGGINFTNPPTTGLCIGNYPIVVMDANGCQANQNVVINQPSQITYTAIATSGTCGLATGQYAFTSITGGTGGPYTISYSGSPFTNTFVYTLLPAGFDTIIIQDAGGCQVTGLALINNIEAPFIVNTTVTDNLCYGGTAGSIESNTSISLGGLPPPYNFSINGGPFGIGNVNAGEDNIFAGLANGQFVTIVQDANGCISLDTLTITSPPQLTLSYISSNLTCNGNNTGNIQFFGGGGTPLGAPTFGYLYSIDNGLTTNSTGSFTGLAAGTYQPYMEDGNGCPITLAPIVITEPPALLVNPIYNLPLCYNTCDGTIQLNASGGLPGYLYSINNGVNYFSSNNFTSVCSGSVDYVVKDLNQCLTVGSILFPNPPQLTLTTIPVNSTCNFPNGTITVNGIGGTGTYTYNLNGGVNQAPNLFSGLAAATYSVFIQDANYCIAQTTQQIVQTGSPSITNVTVTNPSCNGGTGTVNITASGGTPIYAYSIDGGAQQGASTFSSIAVGPHIVTVTDIYNCSVSSNFTVTQPPILAMNIPIVNPVSCNGASTGGITINPTGGTSPYLFSFDGGLTFGSSNNVSSIPAGTYNIQVHDVNNCQVTINTTIAQPTPIVTAITQINASCNAICDGQISLNASGGTGVLTYNWASNIAPNNSGIATSVCAGSYSVIVTDNNGCSITTPSITITEPAIVDIISAIADSVNCFGESNGGITVLANNAVTYTITGTSGTITNVSGVFVNLLAGYYNITVFDAIGCQAQTNVYVYEPDVLILNTTGDVTTCFGIPVTYSGFSAGGTFPYYFTWNTGANTQSLVYSAQVDTILTVSVIDSRGCALGPLTMNITVIPQISIDPIVDQYVCAGDSVLINATAQNGVPGYLFNWTHTNQIIDTSSTWLTGSNNPSSYWIIVKDQCLQYDSTEVLVYEFQAPTFDLTGPINGCAPQTENFNVVNISSPISNCTWDFGNTFTAVGCGAQSSTYNTAGIYSVNFDYEAFGGCPFDTTFTNVLEIFEVPIIDSIDLTNPLCFGSSDGSIIVYGSLGNLPYDYQLNLNPTQLLNQFTSLAAGTYAVTLSDLNSCFVDTTVNLINPPQLGINSITIVDILCNGLSTGSITIGAIGGTPSYEYSFDNGLTYGTSNTLGSLLAGTYNVAVRDANMCLVDSLGIQINEPALLEFNTITVTDASCYSECDGVIDVNIIGGVVPYSYAWSINASTGNTNLSTSLCDGFYNVVVTDANLCQIDSLQIPILEPAQITVTALIIDSISCFGANDGQIQVAATNGNTYELTGPMPTVNNSTGSFLGLQPGSYTITIFDINLCSVDTTVDVFQPTQLTLTISGDTTVCFATPVIHTATGAGGTPAYAYSWDNGAVGNSINYTALQDTTLVVTITDANGCTLPSQTIQITVIPVLYIDLIASQTICIGDSILTTAVAHDGLVPYNYSWSNLGGVTTGNQQYLQGTNNPNSYWVKVTDQCNNMDSTEVLVYNYQAPTFNLTGPVDGCAPQLENFSISGASSPISNCTWDFGNGLTAIGCGSQTSNYLNAGVYSVLFSYDAFTGCSFDTTFIDVLEIYENPIIDSIVLENPLCFGSNDASVTIYASNGTPAYTYQLGAGALQLNNDFTGLTAGFYSITLNDDNNCGSSTFINLFNPPALAFTLIDVTDALCFNSSDGEIEITASGGTAPYQYSFDGGLTYSPNSIETGLIAGTYHIVVRDTNLCMIEDLNVQVNEPTILVINPIVIADASCFGFSDGSISTTVIGGTTAYSYTWSANAATGNVDNAINLLAGTYNLTVTDFNNCSVDSNGIVVGSPPEIVMSTIATDSVNCFGGADGSVTFTALNATLYSITPLSTGIATPNQANATFNGLQAGLYSVLLTDANGCTFDSTFQIFEPNPLEITSVLVTSNLCFGDNTGGITVTATGGTGTYSYSFGGSAFGLSNSNLTLAAGTYLASVQDANSCQVDSFGILITEPTALNIDLMTIVDPTCFGENDGSITAAISGGVGPYTYDWTPGSIDSLAIINLTAGLYDLQVTDFNGCTIDSNNNFVGQPAAILFASITIVDASCYGLSDGTITVVATGGNGAGGYSYTWSANAATGNVDSAINLATGSYSVTILDGNNCSVDSLGIMVGSPAQLLLTVINVDSANCFGGADGSVTFTAPTATSYSITPISSGIATPTQANATFNNLSAGSYSVQIADANGCTFDSTFQIFEPTPVVINSVVVTPNLCFGDNTGGITITASGGTAGYTYSFGGSAYGVSNSNLTLSAGTYVASVQDANNCQADSFGILITQPTALNVNSLVIVNASCFGQDDGSITATISGGVGQYSYDWTPGTIDSVAIINLIAGLYNLQVTDGNGCIIDSNNISVGQPAQISFVSIVTDSINCFGGSDGVIDVSATNANTYILTGPASAPVITTQFNGFFSGLPAGDYTIELQDALGICSVISDTTLYAPNLIQIVTGNDTTVCANSPANLNAYVNGGVTPYLVNWSGGAGFPPGANQMATTPVTQLYYVNGTDANGCVFGPDSTLVTVFDALTTTGLTNTTICPGATTTAVVTVLTGVPNYTYSWSPAPVSGQGTPSANLSIGNYTVTVVDQCGDQIDQTIAVSNFTPPALVFSGFSDGCAPHSITLNSNNATISNCVWNFGNGSVLNGCGPQSYTYQFGGLYSPTFTFTSADGCVFDTTINGAISVATVPVASYTFSPENPSLIYNTVQFSNTSDGGNTYNWIFGGAGSSSQENPEFVFPANDVQDFNTCLIVSENFGTFSCTDTFCTVIPIAEEFTIYVPNSFTPDNDEHNNTFRAIVLGEKANSFEMLIFDRWGELVFQSNDHEIGWDGTFKGRICPDGVYIWKIRMKTKDVDDVVTKVGHVNLMK